MELQASDGGFMLSLLGERFSADEVGRMHKLISERSALTDNGVSVFAASVEALKRSLVQKDGIDLADMLKMKRDSNSQRKNK